MRGCAYGLALLGLALACRQAPPVGEPREDRMLVHSSQDVPRALGREVRIEGVARDAKLGAAVVGEDGLVVICLDRPGWPDALQGRRVVVRGRLESTADFVARVGPDGAVSQGTEGPILVLRASALEE